MTAHIAGCTPLSRKFKYDWVPPLSLDASEQTALNTWSAAQTGVASVDSVTATTLTVSITPDDDNDWGDRGFGALLLTKIQEYE